VFNLANTMLDRFESLIVYHFDAPAYALPTLLFAILVLALATRRARIAPSMWGVLAVLLLRHCWRRNGRWAAGPCICACPLFLHSVFCRHRDPASLPAGSPAGRNGACRHGRARILYDQNWRVYDRQFSEFRAALQRLPRGQRLVTVLDMPAESTGSTSPIGTWPNMRLLTAPT